MAQEVSKEEFLERVEQKAAAYERQYRGCSQCSLLALQEEFNLPGGSAVLKAAGFMAGGTARLGNMCGALAGAVLALGLAAGRERMEDPMYGEEINEASGQPKRLEFARKLFQRFVQDNGAWMCRDLQTRLFGRSYDLHNPEDYAKFQEAGSSEKCSQLVGRGARLAAEIILEMKVEGLVK